MVDFFHQCSERNKKAIYGTPSWWTAVRPAACHGKILSPQNAINGTPRHHPISTRSPVCTTKRTKTRGQKRNICETWGRTKKEKLLNWAKYSSVVQTTSFPWQWLFLRSNKSRNTRDDASNEINNGQNVFYSSVSTIIRWVIWGKNVG